MKKMITFLLFSFLFHHAHAFSPVRQVQISANSIPQQSGYYNVAGGTVTNLANTNQISSGTYTVNGGTISWINAVSTGTRFDRSTTTFQGGEFSGTRNDNSTTTFLGGGFSGTRNDNSTTTLNGATLNGTKLDNSTTTYTGGQNFQNGISVSTTPTNALTAFQVGATTIIINEPVNISTAPGKGISLQVNNSSITTNSPTYIFGTQTNDSASAGYYGEFVSSSVARTGVPASSGVSTSPIVVSLSAGNWDVWTNCAWAITSGTPAATTFDCGISLTASTLPSSVNAIQNSNGEIIISQGNGFSTSSSEDQVIVARSNVSIAATTRYFMVSKIADGSGTVSTYGAIYARRVR